ncbi:Zn-dependent hydrolase [Pseudomonas sp. BAY1663]|uniref:Zn-dependent hydrolase n=1 Tax=Pseudomonas sp. BAY1663 TaxID=1439940 RepID=UPI00042E0BB9|nr:Zn-dependent hydrolase [Pseudomonas sp. BAY1663]EXF45094.1 Zn-dependent hydrolase [Pseudomonas sp. BAY1663]
MKVLGIFTWMLLGFAGSVLAADELRFSLVRTAQTLTQGEYTWRNGGWQLPPPVDHIAVLVEYRGDRLLFGTGLGRQIDAQWDAEMPWRIKRYGPVRAVRDQLERDGLGIDRILLGCARWEHASGLADYPEVPVLAGAESLRYLRAATPPAVLSSQFRHAVKWQPLRFAAQPYLGYAESLDLFGDGRMVLVPLPGNGALGLFLTLADGRRFFFRGDTLGQPGTPYAQPGIVQVRAARSPGSLAFYPAWVQ